MKQSKVIEISVDMQQLDAIVKLVPGDRRAVAESLAKELVFMSKTLAELKKFVNENGPVDLFQQGANEYYRESPALKSYNTTIQRYGGLYKQLVDMIPKQPASSADSELYNFIKQG
mgnify:CR=1 FL=1